MELRGQIQYSTIQAESDKPFPTESLTTGFKLVAVEITPNPVLQQSAAYLNVLLDGLIAR